MYDSRIDTEQHIQKVQSFLSAIISNFEKRMILHDQSKLTEPEKSIFDEMTPKLAASTYGSEEYNGFLKQMRVGLNHHYANNSHHPEHFANGIKDMSLLDLLEMLVDWKAATLRHLNGNILNSIEINQKRFGYSDELKQIFLNTLNELCLNQ